MHNCYVTTLGSNCHKKTHFYELQINTYYSLNSASNEKITKEKTVPHTCVLKCFAEMFVKGTIPFTSLLPWMWIGNARIGMQNKIGMLIAWFQGVMIRRWWFGPTVNLAYTCVLFPLRLKIPPKTDLLFSLSSFFSSRGDGVAGTSLSEDVSLRASTVESGRCSCCWGFCCWWCCCDCCAYCW